MLREECVPARFYKFVCHSEKFIFLISINVLYPKTEETTVEHVTENQENYNEMRNYFERYYKSFQCVYTTLFPKFYAPNDMR